MTSTNSIFSPIAEPGTWILACLLAFAMVNVIASLAIRNDRRRLYELVVNVSAEPDIQEADRVWLREEIKRSKGMHLLVASPFAPFAILGAIFVGLFEGWKGARREKGRAGYDIGEPEVGDATAKAIKLMTGIDPRGGAYWNDPRRKEIDRLANRIENWNNPVAMVWIAFWLLIAVPLLAISYALSGSIRPFARNIWAPLRDPIISIMSALAPTRSEQELGTR